MSALPAASETSGRLEVVELPVDEAERERVAVEMVELAPWEGTMVAEAEAWVPVVMWAAALEATLLREEAWDARDLETEEADAATDEGMDVE
jgi:hypothetical protein